MEAVTAAVSTAVDAIPDPIVEKAASFYAVAFGDTTPKEFYLSFIPILYVSVLPLICMFCAVIGLCGEPKKSTMGNRILKRVNLAVTADIRLVNAITGKKYSGMKGKKPGQQYVGVTSLKDMEAGKAGKSPIKGKSKDVAEEKKIKTAAKAPKK